MRGLILAWLIGEGIIVYRSVTKEHRPPVPGQMLAATGLFALLAVLAEYEPARGAAVTFAWGVDLAVLLQALPGLQSNGTKPGTKPAKRTKKAGAKPA